MAVTCYPDHRERGSQLRGELLGATACVTDDPVRSEALARQAVEIGRANGNSGLELMAMHAVGQALVQQGRTEEGMSRLDEAMAGVIGGEGGDPLTVAQMSCMTMGLRLPSKAISYHPVRAQHSRSRWRQPGRADQGVTDCQATGSADSGA
jgi:hypothetical protein